MNVYDSNHHYFCRDANDQYVEVDTEREAELIEQVNAHMEEALQNLKELTEIVSQDKWYHGANYTWG